MASVNPRLFVSYSRDDSAFAERLATDLRARGVNVWFDRLDIPTGAPWDIEVEAGLRASQGTLVVLSPTSVASKNVMDEVSFALSEGKRILPVLYQPCAIPLRLARLQYVDFTLGYDEGLRRLVQDLAPTTRGTAAPPPAPTAAAAAPPPQREPPRSPSPGGSAPSSATQQPVSAERGPWPVGKVVGGIALALVCVIALVVFAGSDPGDATGTLDPTPVEGTDDTSRDDAQTPAVTPGTPHPDHPHVIADASGQWVPENGYDWVEAGSANTGGPVEWSPGKVHSDHPHVVAASSEGEWTPAPGYTWVDANSPDLLVKWQPGRAHSEHPNVLAGTDERTWRPADGYDWVNPADQADLRVRKVVAGS
jgi:hypothetical protein